MPRMRFTTAVMIAAVVAGPASAEVCVDHLLRSDASAIDVCRARESVAAAAAPPRARQQASSQPSDEYARIVGSTEAESSVDRKISLMLEGSFKDAMRAVDDAAVRKTLVKMSSNAEKVWDEKFTTYLWSRWDGMSRGRGGVDVIVLEYDRLWRNSIGLFRNAASGHGPKGIFGGGLKFLRRIDNAVQAVKDSTDKLLAEFRRKAGEVTTR